MKLTLLLFFLIVIFKSIAISNDEDWIILNNKNFDIPEHDSFTLFGSDSQGRLFINGGVIYIFDQKTFKPVLINNPVDMINMPDGSKWILAVINDLGGRRLYKLSANDSIIKNITEINASDVLAMTLDKALSAWFLTDSSLVRLNGSKKDVFKYNDHAFSSACPCSVTSDTTGGIWISTKKYGIMHFGGKNWQNFTKENSNLPDSSWRQVKADKYNNIWAISGNPLYASINDRLARFSNGSWQVFEPEDSILPAKTVSAMALDNAGNVWFKPLYYSDSPFRFDGKKFDTTGHPSRNIDRFSSMVADVKGNIWFTSANKAFIAYKKGGPTATAKPVYPEAPDYFWGMPGYDNIKIYWNKMPGKNFCYRIYRNNDSSSGLALVADRITDTLFIDKNVKPGINYCYSVLTYDTVNNIESKKSSNYQFYNLIDVPQPPYDLKLSCSSNGVLLTWYSSQDVYRNPNIWHRVYRSNFQGRDYKLIKDSLFTSSYEDQAAPTGSDIYYVVCSYFNDSKKESKPTNEITAHRASSPIYEDWQVQIHDTSLKIKTMFFTDAGHGWVAADHNYQKQDDAFHYTDAILLGTTDGGLSWKKLSRFQDYSMVTVFFNDNLNGWLSLFDASMAAANKNLGRLCRTTDGGRTWSEAEFQDSTYVTSSIFFLDSLNGWMSGWIGQSNHGYFIETNDGGLSWRSPNQDYVKPSLIKMLFIDKKRGFAINPASYSSYFQYTTDGGTYWRSFNSLGYTRNFAFARGCLWATDNYEHIYFSSDLGQSWETIRQSNSNFQDLTFADSLRGLAAGSNGDIFFTTDGGHNWQKNPCPKSTEGISRLLFIDNMNAWAAGRSTLMRTTSAGLFADKPLPPPFLQAVPDSVAIRLRWDKSYSQSLSPGIRYNIYRSSNSGQNWELIREKLDTNFYSDSINLEPETKYYYCVRTYFAATDQESDASKVVSACLTARPLPPKDITYSLNKRWVSLKWEPASPGKLSYMIYRRSASDTALSLIEKDYMYQSYTDKDIPGWGDYYYALRSKGLVSVLTSDFSDTLHVLVTGIKEDMPTAESQLEVSPNPSESNFCIGYTLSASGHVRLALYNYLSEEVVNLVDKYQESGSYNIDFAAADSQGRRLPSGVYILRLESYGKCVAAKLILK